jgi:hypothetical protein
MQPCARARESIEIEGTMVCSLRRSHNKDLLQARLSCMNSQGEERDLLSLGGCSRERWVSALPQMPTRDGPVLASLERLTDDSGAGRTVDQQWRARRRGCLQFTGNSCVLG